MLRTVGLLAQLVGSRSSAVQAGATKSVRTCMATMASMQSSPSSTDKASVVYTTYSAEDHWREGTGTKLAAAASKYRVHLLPDFHAQGLPPISACDVYCKEIIKLVDVPPAAEETVAAAHSRAWLVELQELARTRAPAIIEDDIDESEVTYITSTSYRDALQAAGCAVACVDAVIAAASSGAPPEQVPTGFSLARPPGHHSGTANASGFCLLNNVAIAARHAQERHGLDKVMIFDFDVHHGDGTQAIFYEDASVLTVDMHQKGVWPGTGDSLEIGRGKGQGSVVNVPLPVRSGHATALRAFDEIVIPAAQRFAPAMILVSAGFDAHYKDPLARLTFQSPTYHALAVRLKALASRLCGGKLVYVLEGGYSSEGLAASCVASFLGLLGLPSPAEVEQSVGPEPDQLMVEDMFIGLKRLHGL